MCLLSVIKQRLTHEDTPAVHNLTGLDHTNLVSLLVTGVVLCVKASAAELSLFTRCLWEMLQQNTEKTQ